MTYLLGQKAALIDEQVVDLQHALMAYFSRTHSRKLRNQALEKASALETSCSQFRSTGTFDNLVVENAAAFAQIESAGVRLISGISKHADSDLNMFLGEQTYNMTHNWNPNTFHDNISPAKAKEYELDQNRVDPRSIESIRTITPAVLEQIDVLIKKTARNLGYAPEELTLNFQDLGNTCYWNSNNRAIEIGKDLIRVIKERRGLRVDISQPIRGGFHEYAGHAAHQDFSVGLPASTNWTPLSSASCMYKSHAEFVAIHSEDKIDAVLLENKDAIGATKQDLERIFSFRSEWTSSNLDGIFTAIFVLKAKRFHKSSIWHKLTHKDPYKHFTNLIDNPVLEASLIGAYGQGFITPQVTQGIPYVVAQHTYGSIFQRLKTKHMDKPQQLERAIRRGLWTYPVFEAAVDYFMENE